MRFLRDRFGASEVFLLTDDERLPAIRTYLALGFVPDFTGTDADWSRVLEQLPATEVDVGRSETSIAHLPTPLEPLPRLPYSPTLTSPAVRAVGVGHG
jgi:hypothetical protein